MKSGLTLRDQSYLAGRNGGSRGEVSPLRVIRVSERGGESILLEGGEEGEIVDALQVGFEVGAGSLEGTMEVLSYSVGIGEGGLKSDPRLAPIDLVSHELGVLTGAEGLAGDLGTDSRGVDEGVLGDGLEGGDQGLSLDSGGEVSGVDSGEGSTALQEGGLSVDAIREYPTASVALEGAGFEVGPEGVLQGVGGDSGRAYVAVQEDEVGQALGVDFGGAVANREKDSSAASVVLEGGRGVVSPELGGQGTSVDGGLLEPNAEVDGGGVSVDLSEGRLYEPTKDVASQGVSSDLGSLVEDYLRDLGGNSVGLEVGALEGSSDGRGSSDLGLSQGEVVLDPVREYAAQGGEAGSGVRAACAYRDSGVLGVAIPGTVGSYPVRISNSDSVFLYESIARMQVKFMWEVVASGLLPVVVRDCTVGENGVTADREVLPYPEFLVHPLWYLPVRATADYTGITVDRGVCTDFLEDLRMDSAAFRVADRTGYIEITMDNVRVSLDRVGAPTVDSTVFSVDQAAPGPPEISLI